MFLDSYAERSPVTTCSHRALAFPNALVQPGSDPDGTSASIQKVNRDESVSGHRGSVSVCEGERGSIVTMKGVVEKRKRSGLLEC